jgi:hypothetical protein
MLKNYKKKYINLSLLNCFTIFNIILRMEELFLYDWNISIKFNFFMVLNFDNLIGMKNIRFFKK